MIKRIIKIKRLIKIKPIIKKNILRAFNRGLKNKQLLSISRTQDILNLIKSRQNPLWIFKTYPAEPENASPSGDDWQRFKKSFVEEYGNEPVKETGMTHSEFMDYFKTGKRECDTLP
jgi:hypothetical protein